MDLAPIDRIARNVSERYADDQRLLTLEELLTRFTADPYPLSRTAVQYLRDAIEHHGSESVPSIGGETVRWRVFDGDPDDGITPLIGQEHAQGEVVEIVSAAAREGRLDRMIVLHGPNGSGKSSLVELLQWGLERYSHEPEGALYALRWIFPKSTDEAGGLGFGGGRKEDDASSFAHLDAEAVSARLVCELRCNPLFVVPDSERQVFLTAALENVPERRKESFSHFLTGNLCPRCKRVYEALLAAYQGDWRRVVRHVQVERVFASRRFRMLAVVTQPQGTADAQLRLLSGEGGLSGLPPFLQSLTLTEFAGDLPDANRGLLEFSDFLKRNLELSKYLLQTTEKGFVTVGNQLLDLDIVFFATANEQHLEVFKQIPEFSSFQARMAFVRIPYLRDTRQERAVYERLVEEMSRSRHVTPHAAAFCARFAVLTRMMAPDPESFDEHTRDLIEGLAPLEKARLYAGEGAPDRLDRSRARELVRAVAAMRDERQREPAYEGRIGASVREMRAALTQAAVRDGAACVAPRALVEELHDMISDPSLYRFLQVEERNGYHDAAGLLAAAAAEFGDRILSDVQEAMALVAENEYDRRFDDYFRHLVAHVQGKLVPDENTGERVSPDTRLLESVERLLPTGDSIDEHRRNLVSRIGAYAVDHPDEGSPDFRRLFPDLLRALKREFFEERRETVDRVQRHMLRHGTPAFDDLPPADRELAERTLTNLTGTHGYCDHCAKDAIRFALDRLSPPESDDGADD